MPKEDEPDYSTWKDAILAEVGDLDAGAILVGHSIGGTILIYALAEANPKRTPDAVFLVAPAFFGDGGWPGGEAELRADLADRLPKGMPVYLYHGTKDNDVPFEHMDLYAKAVPQATSRSLAGRDHQLNNDLSDVARDIRNEL